jgi:hypothetical protein
MPNGLLFSPGSLLLWLLPNKEKASGGDDPDDLCDEFIGMVIDACASTAASVVATSTRMGSDSKEAVALCAASLQPA